MCKLCGDDQDAEDARYMCLRTSRRLRRLADDYDRLALKLQDPHDESAKLISDRAQFIVKLLVADFSLGRTE